MRFLLSIVLISVLAESNQHVVKTERFRKRSRAGNDPDLRVTTDHGIVEGIKSKTEDLGKVYYSFRGIPYAQKPVGDLRFEPPRLPKRWGGVLKANKDSEPCTQHDNFTHEVIGSEDCLYINVYTPQLVTPGKPLLAVMVWIYGGGYNSGDSRYITYGPDYLLNDDVVIVSFNYRVGVLGFLSTEDLVVPGNNGLKDQIAALHWVKNNVAAFGGDPNQVTIFGESAGGGSIGFLLQSKLADGLYKRAILESGNSLCFWAYSFTGRENAFNTGKALNIDAKDSKELIEGLKKVPYKRLQQAAADVANVSNPFNLVLSPVSEPEHAGAVFTGKPHEQLVKGHFSRVPIMIGFTSEEGNGFIYLLRQYQHFLQNFNAAVPLLVPLSMNIKDEAVLKKIGLILREHYFKKTWDLTDAEVIHYVTDDQFVRSTREFVRLVRDHIPTYYYRLSYLGDLGQPYRGNTTGVGHAEDLNYLFNIDDIPKPTDQNDVRTRRRLVRLWTNFAKTANPTPEPDPLLQNVIWKTAAATPDLTYLDINSDLILRRDPESESMALWDHLYKTYGHPPYTTY